MGFLVSDELTDRQLEQLMVLYKGEWWSNTRTLPDVQRMLHSSDILFVVTEEGAENLLGFARVLTDDVYYALVLDVIVGTRHRGRGLGKSLMDAVISHPRLLAVRSIELVCQPELVEFYKKWEFTDAVGRSLLMRRTDDSLLAGQSRIAT